MNEIHQRFYDIRYERYCKCSKRDIKKVEFTGRFQAKRSEVSYFKTEE